MSYWMKKQRVRLFPLFTFALMLALAFGLTTPPAYADDGDDQGPDTGSTLVQPFVPPEPTIQATASAFPGS